MLSKISHLVPSDALKIPEGNFGDIAQELKPIDLPPLAAEPLVSVLMANYNYGKYIGQALESVFNQTYQNFEIVVCDDGSTDDSREVAERYAQRDPRVRLIAKENGGVASAVNAAFAVSRGEVICLLDSDDMFLPQKAEEVVRAFRRFSRAGVCHHKLQKVDAQGRAFGRAFPEVFAEGWVAPQALRGGGLVKGLPPRQVSATSGMSWRREVADLLFPVPSELHFGWVDGYLSQVSQFVTEICAVQRVLGWYRCHGQNAPLSTIFKAKSFQENLRNMNEVAALPRRFLRARYGEALASRFRLEDNSVYCRHVAALYVQTRAGGKNGREEAPGNIVARIEPFRQRLLVRFLLLLPPRLARRLLRLWAGSSPGDAALAQAARWILRL